MKGRLAAFLFSSFLVLALAAIGLAAYLEGRGAPPSAASAAAPTQSALPAVEPSPSATPLPAPTATSTPDPGASLTLAVPGLPDSLDPLQTRDTAGQMLAGLVFSGLARPTSDGRIVPDLAAAWRVSGGGTVWDVDVRADARWHDGMPVTPADVVFTVGRAKGSWLGSMWQGITVEQTGPETARFHVPSDRAGSFAALASLPLLPAHLLGVDAQGAAQFQSTPIGSGPFKVVRIDAIGASLARVVPRVPGGGNIETVRVLFASGERETLPLVRSGDADVGLLPVADAPAAATTPGVVVWRVPRLAETVMLLNVRSPALADERVRHALSVAIDRRALVDSALGGLGIPSDEPLPNVVPPSSDVIGDVATANAALDLAGWRLGANGVRLHAANGAPLRLVILTSTDPARLAVARNVAEQLRSVGVDAGVEQVGTEGLVRDFLARGHFDAAILGLAWGLPSPFPLDWWRAPAGTPVPENFSGLADGALDSAAATAEAETEPTAQAIDLAQFGARFHAVQPAVPLYQPVWLLAAAPRITGVAWGNDASPGDLVRGVVDWRIGPR